MQISSDLTISTFHMIVRGWEEGWRGVELRD